MLFHKQVLLWYTVNQKSSFFQKSSFLTAVRIPKSTSGKESVHLTELELHLREALSW